MAKKNTSIPASQRNWKPKRQYYNDKYCQDLKQGGMTPTQAAFRSGYLKAAKHDAESFKYGAARFRGFKKKDARAIADKTRPAEIKGVKVKREFYEDK